MRIGWSDDAVECGCDDGVTSHEVPWAASQRLSRKYCTVLYLSLLTRRNLKSNHYHHVSQALEVLYCDSRLIGLGT